MSGIKKTSRKIVELPKEASFTEDEFNRLKYHLKMLDQELHTRERPNYIIHHTRQALGIVEKKKQETEIH